MPKTESETELKLLILLWPNGGQKGANTTATTSETTFQIGWLSRP